MASTNPWEQWFDVDPATGQRKVKEGTYKTPENIFAGYFTTPGDASTFDYAKAGYKATTNPWVALQQQGYQQTQNPYSQSYIDTLMNQIRGQAESTIKSKDFAKGSEDLRRQLAGKGVLRGQAYDVTQQERIGDILSAAETQAQEAGSQARLRGMEFESAEDRAAKDYMRRISENLGLYGSQQEEAQNRFLQDYMRNYMSGEQARAGSEADFYNQLVGREMDWTVADAERERSPEYQQAVQSGFGGYADPVGAYKVWLADPNNAAGYLPYYGEGTQEGEFDEEVKESAESPGAGWSNTGEVLRTDWDYFMGTRSNPRHIYKWVKRTKKKGGA